METFPEKQISRESPWEILALGAGLIVISFTGSFSEEDTQLFRAAIPRRERQQAKKFSKQNILTVPMLFRPQAKKVTGKERRFPEMRGRGNLACLTPK